MTNPVNHNRVDNLVSGSQFRGVRRPPVSLNGQEVAALMHAVGYRTKPRQFALRNKAFVTVIWRAGLRLREALDLRPHDLDLGSKPTITVNNGKGSKQRTVGIDADAALVLRHWVETRSRMGFTHGGYLFPKIDGGKWSSRGAEMMIERACERAKLTKRVTPHALRHTYAVELVKEGIPMPYIQQALGHANLAVTSRYLSTIAPGEVTERLNRRVWDDDARSAVVIPRTEVPTVGVVTHTGDDDWDGGRAMLA